ncbi:hypothetical protein A0J61_02755 [Choanephora cucurbitarum]|uniref:Uncharacterized protein n=1 Tax=Choanephora cucurbitarum TaxID=101091 RepID=A0A1C7NL41_9FUNG|nr:hypothetical protein A0J61_02755 [Choanephora cucurbitarum]
MMKLNDLVSGKVVTMNEWLCNEIYRLKNNLKPRHFESYGELVEMIQEDPGRFQVCNTSLPPLTVNTLSPKLAASTTVSTEPFYSEKDQREDEELGGDEPIDTRMNYTNIPLTTEYPTQYTKPTLQPPVWLCKAFIDIMEYCDNTNNITYSNQPELLLKEFEELRLIVKLGNSIDVNEFRERLCSILFGKIQMTENLVHTWRMICEWVTRPPVNNHQNAVKWVNLTLGAYIAAQRYYISHRQEYPRDRHLSIAQNI